MDTTSEAKGEAVAVTVKSGGAKWLSEAMLIAGVTAIGYIYATAFQIGFFGARGLPSELIQVNISHVLLVGAAMILALPVMLLSYELLAGMLGLYNVPLIQKAAPAILFAFVGWCAFRFVEAPAYAWVGLALLMVLVQLIFWLGPHWEKRQPSVTPLLFRAWRHGGKWGVVIGALLVLGYFTAYFQGAKVANRQTVHLVSVEASPRVAVSISGDTAILASYDAATGETLARFSVVKLSEKEAPPLEWRNIGLLRMVMPTATRPTTLPAVKP